MNELIKKYLNVRFSETKYCNNLFILKLIDELEKLFCLSNQEALMFLNEETQLNMDIINMYFSGKEEIETYVKYEKSLNPSEAELFLYNILDNKFKVNFSKAKEGKIRRIYYNLNEYLMFELRLNLNVVVINNNPIWDALKNEYSGDISPLFRKILPQLNCEGDIIIFKTTDNSFHQ